MLEDALGRMAASPFRRYGLGLCKALALLTITAALTECSFRVVDHFHPISIFPNDSYNRWRVKPDAQLLGIRANSYGFNDLEPSKGRQGGTFRILGIGDSFAFGTVPYQHNFLTLLDDHLRDAFGNTEVLNMGIPSISTHHYLRLLENEGFRFEPDAVVLTFFIGNDFDTHLDRDQVQKKEGGLYLVAFFRYLFKVLPSFEGQPFKAGIYEDEAPSMAPKPYRIVLKRRVKLFWTESPYYQQKLPIVLELLDRIHAECEARDVELLVVLIPDEIQVDPEVRAQMIQEAPPGAELNAFDMDRPSLLLKQGIERQGIEVLDLLPTMRLAADSGPVYRPRDTHWNIRGNEIAAREIAGRIRELGWIEAPP